MSWLAFATAVAPAIGVWLVIRIALRTRFAARVVDRPNERSLHSQPRPRVGGLAMMVVALPWAAWVATDALRIVLGCAALLCFVSAVDDVRALPAVPRLAAHFAAAALAVYVLAPGAGWPMIAGLGVVLAIAWMTNLFNFMDGSDGLAGGMALIGFAACALAAAASSASALALVCAALASASAGFLAWNFPPARVFLGDAGSVPLGFLAGALGLQGWVAGAWPGWFPVVVFSPFIVDASVTLARRLVRREPVWIAHRGHYYQRLILAGWSHRRVALHGYALMLGAALVAAWAGTGGPMLQCGIIFVWAGGLTVLLIAVERHLRRVGEKPGAPGRSIG